MSTPRHHAEKLNRRFDVAADKAIMICELPTMVRMMRTGCANNIMCAGITFSVTYTTARASNFENDTGEKHMNHVMYLFFFKHK